MARKQNGFGNSKSFAFKGGGRVDKGKKVASVGGWPSDRSFGSIVKPTIIQRFNKYSNWTQWRQGVEIWNKSYFKEFDFGEFIAELFPSSAYFDKVKFKGIKIPAKSTDNSTYYVTKRDTVSPDSLGAIVTPNEVQDVPEDDIGYSSLVQQKINKERWYNVELFTDRPLIPRLILQRLTSRSQAFPNSPSISAIVKNVISKVTGKPAIYSGKTQGKTAKLRIYLPQSAFSSQDEANQSIGKNCALWRLPLYFKNFAVDGFHELKPYMEDINNETFKYVMQTFVRPVQNSDPQYSGGANATISGSAYPNSTNNGGSGGGGIGIGIPGGSIGYTISGGAQTLGGGSAGAQLVIFEEATKNTLSSILDNENVKKFSNCGFAIEAEFVYNKQKHQRFFKTEATAKLIRENITHDSPVFPTGFVISDISLKMSTQFTGPSWIVEVEPFSMTNHLVEISVKPNTLPQYYIVFSTPSMALETSTDINLNVDPYNNEYFSGSFQSLLYHDSYWSCNCPVYSRATLRAPETVQTNGNKQNRQIKYPLPSAGSENKSAFLNSVDEFAGTINSWANDEYNLEFKMCKHTIAAYFYEGKKFVEPANYPMLDERYKLEQQIVQKYSNLEVTPESVQRSEIQRGDFYWTIMQLLNGITSKIFEPKPVSIHEFGLSDQRSTSYTPADFLGALNISTFGGVQSNEEDFVFPFNRNTLD